MTDVVAKPIPSKTDDELKQLARDIGNRQVFVSGMMGDDQNRMLGSVFMPIGLCGLKGVDTSTIGMIYEYYHKAGPRSINGFPMFFSAQLINVEDWARVVSMGLAIEDATEAALEAQTAATEAT